MFQLLSGVTNKHLNQPNQPTVGSEKLVRGTTANRQRGRCRTQASQSTQAQGTAGIVLNQSRAAHNRFHYKCCERNKKSNPNQRGEKMKPKTINGLNLEMPDKGHCATVGSKAYGELKSLLSSNPSLLDQYVEENVSLDSLQSWLDKKRQKLNKSPVKKAKTSNLSPWKVGNIVFNF